MIAAGTAAMAVMPIAMYRMDAKMPVLDALTSAP